MKTWELSSGVAWQEIGGEAVMLSVDSGCAIGLNPTGARVVSLLGARGEGEIAEEIASGFGVGLDQAAKDVREFLAELERRGLIRPGQGC